MLLRARAQALSTAACTLYAAIGDLEPTPCDLRTQPPVQAEANPRASDPGYRAGAACSTPRDALLQKVIPRLATVTDSIATAAGQYNICCLPPPRTDLDALVGVLVAITQETKAMATMLPDSYGTSRLEPVFAGIHALEMRGERLCRQATARLQADSVPDSQSFAQWHDVYEAVAQAIRQCGQIAVFVANTPLLSLH